MHAPLTARQKYTNTQGKNVCERPPTLMCILGVLGHGADGSIKRPPHKTRLICVFMIHTHSTLSHNSHGHNVSSFSLFFSHIYLAFIVCSMGAVTVLWVNFSFPLLEFMFLFGLGPRDIISLQLPPEIYLTYSSSLSFGFLCHLKVICPWASFFHFSILCETG